MLTPDEQISNLRKENQNLRADVEREKRLKHEVGRKYTAAKEYARGLYRTLLVRLPEGFERNSLTYEHNKIFAIKEKAVGDVASGWTGKQA